MPEKSEAAPSLSEVGKNGGGDKEPEGGGSEYASTSEGQQSDFDKLLQSLRGLPIEGKVGDTV